MQNIGIVPRWQLRFFNLFNIESPVAPAPSAAHKIDLLTAFRRKDNFKGTTHTFRTADI